MVQSNYRLKATTHEEVKAKKGGERGGRRGGQLSDAVAVLGFLAGGGLNPEMSI